jgi:D-glycero-D-manno-heptose 1,7-bisphosphate phosphatase
VSRFVFLDRDGTLVRDAGYTHRLSDYALLPQVVEGLRLLADAAFRLAIVTNQSGIGRGYFREEDYRRFQEHLEADLARQGVPIARSYFCPHRPDEDCDCRKPRPGLLERARDELGADLAQSWVIGDAARDVDLARNARCHGAVWLGVTSAEARAAGALAAADLLEAAQRVLAG